MASIMIIRIFFFVNLFDMTATRPLLNSELEIIVIYIYTTGPILM